MNEGSIKKVTNLVKPFLTNNEQLDINIARMIHEFKGTMCDNSGFNQHKGECWNDTLQEIFFFSDGLKDITQPLFYNLDTSTKNLTALVSSKLFPDTDKLNDKEQNTVSKLVKYIRLTKIRFITHYNFLVDIKTQNRPTLTKIYKSKRRYSAVCGIASAKHITNLYKGDSNLYNPGLIYTLKNELFNNLIRIFDIPYIVIALKRTDSLSNINGIFISSNSMMLHDKNTYAFKGGHSFGFLKCDSKWKYYDDNERSGLISVDESIVSLFINEEDVAISVDIDSNIHILKYKLHSGNNTNIKVSITQYYDNNKWNKWTDDANDFRKIYTKNTLSIVRPRIRWANIKRRTAKGGNKLHKTFKRVYKT